MTTKIILYIIVFVFLLFISCLIMSSCQDNGRQQSEAEQLQDKILSLDSSLGTTKQSIGKLLTLVLEGDDEALIIALHTYNRIPAAKSMWKQYITLAAFMCGIKEMIIPSIDALNDPELTCYQKMETADHIFFYFPFILDESESDLFFKEKEIDLRKLPVSQDELKMRYEKVKKRIKFNIEKKKFYVEE